MGNGYKPPSTKPAKTESDGLGEVEAFKSSAANALQQFVDHINALLKKVEQSAEHGLQRIEKEQTLGVGTLQKELKIALEEIRKQREQKDKLDDPKRRGK